MSESSESTKRKELIRAYKETARPAGLFAVRCTQSGRMLVGTSVDLPGMLNRQRFQLEMGGHPDKDLQADWNLMGPNAFEIEVLDVLEPSDEGTGDLGEELADLKTMWIEKLQAAGTELYRSSLR